MLSAIISSNTLTGDAILPELAVALACYCVGDGSALEEWYEPLYESGTITHLIVYMGDKPFVIKGTDYSDLATFPHIAVKYKGDWIGDTSVEDEFKFIFDESGEVPKLRTFSESGKTNIFN